MKRIIRKISLIAFILCLLAMSGAGFYYGRILFNQNRLRALIETEIQRKLGQSISIGQVKLSLWEGLIVDLSAIQLGRKDSLFLSAGNVKVRLSLWRLLRGDETIQGMVLTSPQLLIRLDDLAAGKSLQGNALPAIELEDGTVTAVFKDREFVFSHLNGRLDDQTFQLTGRFLSAETQLFLNRLDSGWTGEITINALLLNELNQQINGTAGLEMRVTTTANDIALETTVKAKEMTFPGGGKPIQELDGHVTAFLSEKGLELTMIRVGTPFITVAGQARLNSGRNFENLEAAELGLTLSTDTFDYEELVRHLPLQRFPDWLTILLAQQIRNGSIHLETITYDGPISAFNAQGDFFNHLKITGELTGGSFGAGHNKDRISEITATVKAENGDLLFHHIQGSIENTRMGSVDLFFPKILDPGRRVEVKVDVDLPPPYFLKAFRAGMWPAEVFHLLDPLGRVQGGRVSAKIIYQEGMEGPKPLIKGIVTLDDCGFAWDNRMFQQISGTAESPEFGRPVDIEVSGSINDFPVTRLALHLMDPLGEARYRFQLEAAQLPRTSQFMLDPDSRILATGSGKGNTVNGGLEIQAHGFELLGRRYHVLEGRIEGAGKLNARLWPEFALDLIEMDLKMPDGRLVLEHHLSEGAGDIFLLGSVAVYEMTDNHPSPTHPLKGHIQLKVAWEDRTPLTGQFHFSDFSVNHGGDLVLLNGPLALQGDLLSTNGLSVLRKNIQYHISGDYNHSPPSRFTGDVAIQGLRISKQDSEGTKLPEDIVAEAGLTFTDLELYGVSFEAGSTKARLENGKLKFYGAELNGRNGSLKGEVEMSNSDPSRIDLSIDLQDQGVEHLLNTLYADKNLIQGRLKAQGRLTGTAKNLNGRLSFSAREGHTMKSSLVTKLFGALNFYKIIKSRNLNLKEERFAFNNIMVNLTLKDSVAAFDDFYLDSDSIQLSAVGTYAINTSEIDAVVGVQPLETIDRAVSAIPVIGWVLTGDGGKLIVVTLGITGTTGKPVIELAPVNAISAQMADTLLRVLKLPERLINKPKTFISGEKN